MAVASVGSSSSASSASIGDSQRAFRGADFLKIMLKEVTTQSPFDPQETSKLVENMTKLQDLANANYQKYRNDLRWAQDLVGKLVNATQFTGTPAEAAKLKEQGLRIDEGFANVDGKVEGFRVYDETVYVAIGGKDYPLDNVKQVLPAAADTAGRLAEIAARMLGMQVGWTPAGASAQSQGIVSQVSAASDGAVMLTVNGSQVPFSAIQRIGLAPAQ